MSTDDVIKIIVAVVGVLTLIGGGLKWVASAFLTGLKENTKAVTDSSKANTEAMMAQTKAIAEATMAQTEATHALRIEMRELRVEVRTLADIRGDLPPVTPIMGVPETPPAGLPTAHLVVHRRGTDPRRGG
jgi:hypothetical protein